MHIDFCLWPSCMLRARSLVSPWRVSERGSLPPWTTGLKFSAVPELSLGCPYGMTAQETALGEVHSCHWPGSIYPAVSWGGGDPEGSGAPNAHLLS